MNNFFVNAVSNLNIEDPFSENIDKNLTGIAKALKKFENHLSILKIKELHKINESFTYSTTSVKDIEFEISRLNTNKTTVDNNDIPLKFSQKMKTFSLPLLPKSVIILRMIVIFQTL